jgi:hypothetical protein
MAADRFLDPLRFASYEWCKTAMTKSLVGPTTESTTDASTSHKQLTIPLCSGAFAATTAWVRNIWMDDCLRVDFSPSIRRLY